MQEAGRQTAAALDEIARRRQWKLELLSLNDAPGPGILCVHGRELPIIGFGRSKGAFTWSAMGRARRGIGIVVAGHPHFALPAWLMRTRSSKLKTIVMSHGIEVWKPLPTLRKLALRQADCVLAPSADTARKLTEMQLVEKEKVSRLAWPVSDEILGLADDPASLQPPIGFPRGQMILTVGRWAASERYKGADDLIEAVAQLSASIPELFLVAVGGGDDLPRLRKIASDCEVADRVSFLEGLSRHQIAACYERCTIFALPSTGEGFGIVFLEAMAFGKPVIGVASGGVPDLIENGVTGLLIPPRDKKSLAEALRLLLADFTLRDRLGRQGADFVRRGYTFATFERGLKEIVDTVLASSTV